MCKNLIQVKYFYCNIFKFFLNNINKLFYNFYSTAGAVLLSFGSVLVWAVLRSIVPPNPTLCTIIGIGSGLAFIKVGSSYLNFVDEQIPKK